MTPKTKSTIEKAQLEAKRTVTEIIEKDDSTFRLYHWSNLLSALIQVLEEEKLHKWKLPSPHNPRQ